MRVELNTSFNNKNSLLSTKSNSIRSYYANKISFGALRSRYYDRGNQPNYNNLYQKADSHVDAEAVFKLFPRLMGHDAPSRMVPIMKKLEDIMDRFHQKGGKPKGIHGSEAELMALCFDHPKNGSPYPQNILDPLCRGITSIFYFINHKINKLPNNILYAWGRIGNISHGFLALKYDARGNEQEPGKKSLLSQYGFKFVTAATAKSEVYKSILEKIETKYGKGFILGPEQISIMKEKANKLGFPPIPPLEEDTYILLRQPFLVITNKKYGTLLIRNSSPNPKAGRNLRGEKNQLIMPHPSYWSPRYFADDISAFDPEVCLKPLHNALFKHVLDPSLYFNHSDDLFNQSNFLECYNSEKPLPDQSIRILTIQLDEWRDHYRLWKYNTEVPANQHLAPGFVPFISKALSIGEEHLRKGLTPLAIILTSHRYTALLRFPWKDAKAKGQWQYILDKSHIAELRNYMNGGTSHYEPHQYEALDFKHFFQAAVRKRADLVLANASEGKVGEYNNENS